MIEGENQESQNQEIIENQQPAPVEKQEEAKVEPEVVKPELTDDAIKEYFKSKGREVEDLETLFKAPEVKEVNPYAELLDDEDKAYFEFKKTTGRGRKEYESLNKDYDKVNPIELARERVLKEAGISLTTEQIDEYLADTLGIEDFQELSAKDRIELAKYAKPVRDEYKSEQEKYRKPVEKKPDGPQTEFVKLTNGAVMPKSEYEKQAQVQQQHIEKAKEAVNSVTASEFKIAVDENGSKKELEYKYEFSDEDRQSLVSDVSNLEAVMQKEYHTKDGFNHKQFGEDRFWMKKSNREKAISAIAQAARAEAIEEVLKTRGNVNFDTRSTGLPSGGKEGVKYVPVKDLLNS